MKTVIFHVGTPKTGSSALQVSLARMSDELKLKGLDYISIGEYNLGKAGRISSGNGAYIARTVLKQNDPSFLGDAETHKSQLVNAINTSKRDLVVVSSELFTFADPNSFRALLETIKAEGHEAKAFYFVRSPVQSIASSYIQQVKRHHCTERPEDWVSAHYKDFTFLKTHAFYCFMQSIFGANNVICRSYDAAILHPLGVVKIFLDACGVEFDQGRIDKSDVNAGLTAVQIALMLSLNVYKPRPTLTDGVVALNGIRGLFPLGFKHNFLPLELTSKIDEYYHDENNALAKLYFHRDRLFPDYELPPPSRVPSLNELDLADVVDFFSSLAVLNNNTLFDRNIN